MATPFTMKDLKAAIPTTSGTITVPGIDGSIAIFRDKYGIPHIKATTTKDAFFGQGFATSQDRLWHMEHDRRMAYGRWAEVVGDDAIEQDKLMRKLQIRSAVEIDYNILNDESRSMLDAYTAGVNAFLDTTNTLPVEFEIAGIKPDSWHPQDSLAIFTARHILMGVFEGKLWRAQLINTLGVDKAAEIIPDYPTGHLVIDPPGQNYTGGTWDVMAQLSAGAAGISWLADAEGGSNNWALMGSRTASGKPLVAGDPHRPLDTPNVYYQNHIACPNFDAIGLSFPGCPGFPHFGHNAHVAWCVTHAQADYQDLYVERVKDGSFEYYEWKGNWRESDLRLETIRSKSGKKIDLEVIVTHHGSIIIDDPSSNYGIAFKHTGTSSPNNWSQCLPRMLRSRSANDMDEAMREWVDPGNNFVFADVNGNVEYLNRGRLPIRPDLNHWLPVPGSSGEYEWEGFVPFDEQVRIKNPEGGYIVTANNKIAPDSYPHYIALHFSPEYRARSIKDMLDKLDKATVEDMLSIHAAARSIPARIYMKLLEQIEPQDEISARGKSELEGWDGTMDKNSIAPTIYSAFKRELEWMLLEHHLGPMIGDALSSSGRGAPMHLAQMRARFVTAAENSDSTILPDGQDWNSVAATALSNGMTWLKVTLGDQIDTWQWGRVHSTKPQHTLSAAFPALAPLLDPPSVPMNGDGDTPHAGTYAQTDPFTVNGCSTARYVFDLSDWDNSRWVTPLGSSGHPGSQHYSDQTPIWAAGEVLPMLYDWNKIREEAQDIQQLEKRVR